MTHIVLSHGDERLSVKLTIDMSAYCLASKIIKQNVPQPTAAEHAASQKLFDTERERLCEITSQVSGELLWNQIKKLLHARCDHDNLAEKEFASALISSDKDEPHVLHTLNLQFVELLKNSIDAIIGHYLLDDSDISVLDMNIKLDILKDNISVIITDNAGGFTSDYIARFTDMVARRTYKDGEKHSEKRADLAFYFGGRGLGLRQICGIHLAGEESAGKGVFLKTHVIPESSTQIIIRNNPITHGAEIILGSPLAPFATVHSERHLLTRPPRASFPDMPRPYLSALSSGKATSAFCSPADLASSESAESHVPFDSSGYVFFPPAASAAASAASQSKRRRAAPLGVTLDLSGIDNDIPGASKKR